MLCTKSDFLKVVRYSLLGSLNFKRLILGKASRVVDIKEQIDGLASMSEIASCSYEARKFGIKNGMFLGQAVKLCPDLKTLPYDFEVRKNTFSVLYLY